ncbi:hypothetical protein HMPREF0971_01314 [Segatella oris F0302]|uniref:Uncharacterized protein n=1 Tax=Segatella oris F0302 TaxID=649760 RepID=D1QQR3_9BACT|nr:hypothetical protein HMPREF0971_01314 [Segatella oris F0302]
MFFTLCFHSVHSVSFCPIFACGFQNMESAGFCSYAREEERQAAFVQ